MPARTTKKKTTKKKTTRAKTTGLVKHKITLGKGDDPGDIRVSKTVTYNTRGVFGGNKTV